MISESELMADFVPAGSVIYRNSREGMLRELKTLMMALYRTPEREPMKREKLVIKIAKLKAIREDMKVVIKIAEGTNL
jgi:hypothetical protein